MTKIYGAPFKTVCLAIVASNNHMFKGAGGTFGSDIKEKEFEYLSDRGGHGGHLAETFLKKILFLSRVIAVTVSRFACRY